MIVTDWNMPDIKGPDLLSKVKSLHPNTVRVIFTGISDQEAVVSAINTGQIFRFIVKPSSPIEMARVLDESFDYHRLLTARDRLISETVGGTVKVLLEVLSVVAPQAYSKTQRLLFWVEELKSLSLDLNYMDLELAVKMSQIGYTTLPPAVLYKLDQEEVLGVEEERMLQKIPEESFRLLKQIPKLEAVARAVRYQNKTYNGQGYPEEDLKGDDLPVISRILKIFNDLWLVSKGSLILRDDFDALYRKIERYDRIYFELCRLAILKSKAEKKVTLVNQEVSVSRLQVDDILACDVREIEGRLLLAKGHRLSATQIERLKNIAEIRNITYPIKILRQISTSAVDLDQTAEA